MARLYFYARIYYKIKLSNLTIFLSVANEI